MFRRRAEHVVSRLRYDLEMQIFHTQNASEMDGAVISIFFDTDSAHTEKLDKAKIENIDKFFNSLKLNEVKDG